MGAARIEAAGLVAGYGRRDVLQGVSLALRGGEFVGLIGPNGSGKSTLLRTLTRTLPLRAGMLTYDGELAGALARREIARRIAFVPQSEPSLFEFTVREVVLMGRHPRLQPGHAETPADYAAATRAMAAADILQLADRPVTALSGGEHRRVLIARALAQEAPAMLLDEPTAHLDVTHQAEVLSVAGQLADCDGVAVLAALHDLNVAAAFCDRLLLLRDGRIVAQGAPQDVLTSDALEQAYGPGLVVSRSAAGAPTVMPLPPQRTPVEAALRVHVVCGGGTGGPVLAALQRRGYAVSAGVLNRLDSDQEACAALEIEHAAEAPFSPIGEASRAACAELMRRADAIIVTEVPIGRGNLANLELAHGALRDGVPVFLLGGTPVVSRDFASGAGAAAWQRLLDAGAQPVADLVSLERRLGRVE